MSPRRTGRAAAPDALAAPDMPGPPSVEVAARHVRTGDDWSATLAVTGYPAEVSAGWLEPLLSYPGRVDVTLHIEPIPVAVAAARLRRQRARLESGRRAGIDRGQLDDPDTEAAADDARDLAYRLARGEGKLFRLGLYLTVHAGSEEDLAAEVQAVRALAASPAAGHRPGHLPRRCRAGPRPCRPGPTSCCCAAPWTPPRSPPASRSPAPTCPATPPTRSALPGVLYGAQHRRAGAGGLGPVGAADNHNSVTLAASGAGKSYLAKLEILRSLYEGTECWVIDPEDEYARLAGAVGGAYIHLGAPGVHLNPFDLPAAGRARPDTLTRRALFIHTVIAVLLRRRAVGGRAGRAGQGDHDRLPAGRDHRRPAHLGAARPAAARPGDRAARREDPGRDRAGRPAGPVHRGQPLRPVLRPDHHPPRGAPGRLLAARRPRRAAPGRDPARPGHHLAGGLRPRPQPAAADHRGRGVAADARPRGRQVPVPAGQVRPQGVGRAGRGHPGRRGRAVHRPGPGRDRQLRHPDPAPPGPPGHRQGRRGVPAVGRGAAAAAVGPPGRGPLAAGPSSRVSFQAIASPAEHFLCTSDPAEIARMQAGQPAAAGPAWPDGAAEEDQEDLLP